MFVVKGGTKKRADCLANECTAKSVWVNCPVCHNKDQRKMNVVRRTCGYLGEKFWNVGKTKEIKARVTHL